MKAMVLAKFLRGNYWNKDGTPFFDDATMVGYLRNDLDRFISNGDTDVKSDA